MDGISGILLLVALLIIMQMLVVVATERTAALARWKSVLALIALVWWFTPMVKKAYVDDVFYPNDSIVHEEAAREIAYLINQRDWQGANDYLGFGNEGYRFFLGGFYAATNAPEVVTYAIHGMLGFWGLLTVLEIICIQTSANVAPFWIVAFVMLNPSALFWTTFNLKEGAMLWGLCMMLRAVLTMGELQRRESMFWPFLGLMTAGLLRPHIVMAYLGALSIGVAVRQRKLSFAIVTLSGIFAGVAMLKVMAPVFFETVAAAGLTSTLSERFLELNSDGGSAITYARGTPIPLVSGVILLTLRPFIWEANDITTLAAGAEIWFITCTAIFGWYRLNQRLQLATTSCMMTVIVAVLALSLYFTYIYNMGLMVRQRVMVYPALMMIATIPAMALVNGRFSNATSTVFRHRPTRFPFQPAIPQPAGRNAFARSRRSSHAPRVQPSRRNRGD